MLSICIPIYNFNITALVNDLTNQINAINDKCEIVLIDDASNVTTKNQNKIATQNHTYIELEKNIGRAKIRNLFLKYVHYDYLLFLDGDSLMISDNFILNYIQSIKEFNPSIVCGGRVYPLENIDKNHLLSWTYGTYRESKKLEEREKNPNASFMTNNFLIQKTLFTEIPFDEELTEYGHEDTLFGFELAKRNIRIKHIDNPVLNGDIESNLVYIEKTEKAILNLISILKRLDYHPNFIKDIALLKIYYRLKNYYVLFIIRILFFFSKSLIKKMLRNGIVSLPLFDFYKLGYLTERSL